MINVGFILYDNVKWVAGINYFRNLLSAINTISNRKIEVYLFVGKKFDPEIVKEFESLAHVIKHPLFDKKSRQWYLWKLMNKLFASNYLLTDLFKKHNISVISHSGITNRIPGLKIINWIPDFQHMILPKNFTKEEIHMRDKSFLRMAQNSDKIILSSFDSLKDYKIFVPEYYAKGRVLQFVSQVGVTDLLKSDIDELMKKYNFTSPFFFLPNQFWYHKNHIVVFKAIKSLKEKGKNVLLLCSGDLNDYRQPDHLEYILNYLKENQLTSNIKLLGRISYNDVVGLIRNSISVINPSFFEGWSTTVEECKSLGKNIILSNINVHIEQKPESCIYFNPKDSSELSEVIEKRIDDYKFDEGVKGEDRAIRKSTVEKNNFGINYQNIVLECSNLTE